VRWGSDRAREKNRGGAGGEGPTFRATLLLVEDDLVAAIGQRERHVFDQAAVAVKAWLDKGSSRRLIAVINNAAYADTGPVEFMSTASIRKQFEVNVVGQIAVTQALLPLIRRGLPASHKDGFYPRVIFVTSLATVFPTVIHATYSATKAAMDHIVDGMRIELGHWGIRVISVLPGAIKTNFSSKWDVNNYLDRPDIEPNVAEVYREAANKFVNNNMPHAPPYIVTKALVSAVLEKNPSRRYLAGKDAHVLGWAVQFLPEQFVDLVWSSYFRAPNKSRKS